ncbi:MAG: hypothetical protein SPI18_10715 [Prevotella sp.]|nr:hypothetical protein [Prevotella sp.]
MNKILWTFLSVCLSSCVTSGLYSGYKHLNEEEKLRVIEYQGDIDNLRNDGNVYKVRVSQVKELINKYTDVVVYEYTSFCTNKSCVPPYLLESFCQTKGYKLVVVSTIYDNIWSTQRKNIPLLTIDTAPYKTDLRFKYEKRFFDELTGIPEKQRNYGIFYYFHNSQFIKDFSSHTDIP